MQLKTCIDFDDFSGETWYTARSVLTHNTEYLWSASVYSYDMDRGDGRIYRKHGNSCHLLLYCKYLKIQCVHNIPYINSLVFMSINIHRCCKYSFDEYTHIYSWRITSRTYIVILIYCLYFIVDPIHSETRYSEGHN